MKKEVAFALLFLIIFLPFMSANIFSDALKSEGAGQGFKTSQAIIKAVVKEGESASKTLTIENNGEKKSFSLESVNLDNKIFLAEKSFTLNPEEKKDLQINLLSGNLEPGIYTGSVKINGNGKTSYIPIIIEVQSSELIFVVNLDTSAKYKTVGKENEAVTEISLFNIKDVREHQTNVDYKIINVLGETVKEESETVTVRSELKYTKNMVLPEDIADGDYIFTVELKTNGTLSTSSYLFQVEENGVKTPLNLTDLATTIIAVFLFLIILVTIYILYERKKLISELARQHSSEIKTYSHGIEKKKQEALSKTKDKKKRLTILREFKEAKNKILSEIRKEHKVQREEYRKLKKKKDEKTIKKRMGEWKKETYPIALKRAEINSGLKSKLGILKHAYTEGLISEDSYKKGSSRIKRKIK